MKKLNLVLLTSALVVILLAVEVVIVKSASKYEPQTSVIYSRVKIPQKTVIREEMLEEKKVAASMAHRQSFRKMSDIVGKRARIDMEEGEMVLSAKLGPVDEMEEIKVKNKDGRLFSIEFKGDQANGWWLMTDQYVDILFVPNEKAKDYPSSEIHDSEGGMESSRPDVRENSSLKIQRLRNIRIAAIIDERGKLLKNAERTSLPKYVSFEVTQVQDEFLAYAKGNGRLEISVIPEITTN